MRKLLQKILLRPVLWFARRFASRIDSRRVYTALDTLYKSILEKEIKKGLVVPFDSLKGRFIILSDQHKGAKNYADDFMGAEPNYLAALEYYHIEGFHFISLGDCEELWENSLTKVMECNEVSIEVEKKFISHNAFTKIFGNHDLHWGNNLFAAAELKKAYEHDVKVYEGVVLQTMIGSKPLNIFCTHGHQGDELSDGNWFSKIFIARIWAPLQAYLRINPNTPAYDSGLKTRHNSVMYEWAKQRNDTILITGHTHQPVFESLTHLERLYKQLLMARQQNNSAMISELEKEIDRRKWEYRDISPDYLTMKSNYFNSGCCCFNDGDITGIEIADGALRLIKWKMENGVADRKILEETSLDELVNSL